MNELFLKELIFLIHVGKNRTLVHPPNFVFIGPIIPYKQLLFNHYSFTSKIVEKKLYSWWSRLLRLSMFKLKTKIYCVLPSSRTYSKIGQNKLILHALSEWNLTVYSIFNFFQLQIYPNNSCMLDFRVWFSF
jgi:hypothetical protein